MNIPVGAAPPRKREPTTTISKAAHRRHEYSRRSGTAAKALATHHPQPVAAVPLATKESTIAAIDTPQQPMNSPPSQRSHALRIGRFSEAARVYLVTTVTHERKPLFTDFWLARQLIRELRKADNSGACKTLAFVVMPDHLHWLFQLSDKKPLPKVVGQVKAGASAAINQEQGTPGVPRWQKGFHDRALRCEEDLRALARYVVANPVRAGIVQRVGSYPHWDAIWL